MDKCSGFLFMKFVFIFLELLHHGFCVQNVALGKPAQQSGAWNSRYSADKAVDNKTGPGISSNECAHPHSGRLIQSDRDYYKPAWWRVDLGQEYDIYEIVIHNRDDNRNRLQNNWVLVSNEERPSNEDRNICYELMNDLDIRSLRISFNCTYNEKTHMQGRYVMIQRKSTAPEYWSLNICEVEVMSCPPGRWGVSDCSQMCSSSCVDEECAVSDGFCYKGCTAGSWSPTTRCSQQCPTYCVDDMCYDDTGYCIKGCRAGWWGATCNKTCFCENGSPCNIDSGHCPGNCHQDYVGVSCSVVSPQIPERPTAMYDSNTKVVEIEFSTSGLDESIRIFLVEIKRHRDAPWANFFTIYQRSVSDKQTASNQAPGGVFEANFRLIPFYNAYEGKPSLETGFILTQELPQLEGIPVATYDANSDSVTVVFSAAGLQDEVEQFMIEKNPHEKGTWAEFHMINRNYTNELQIAERSASDLGSRTNFRVIPFLFQYRGKASLETGFISTQASQPPPGTTSIGIIAGIAVAALVLIILIIVVIVLFFRCRKRGKTNNKKEALVASKPNAGDHTYENPVALKQENGYAIPRVEDADELKSVEVDGPYNVPKATTIPDGITKPPPRSATPEVLPSEDEEEQIYDNPITFPPIKVSELSSYIEERKGEVDAFKREYQQLPAGDKAKWEAGNKVENRNKNRFVNIRAYDHSRVILSVEDGDIHSDYINADFITGYKDEPKVYVAAQGPKKSTLVDTWRMLWELNANRMVMVTNLVENGKIKCEKYWPDTEEQYGKFKVATTSNEIFADFSIKQFKVTYEDETRTIHHLHFTSWPDHGVPITATALLNFRKRVRSYDDIATGPMVVHCSAGVGRTGTFIALDYLLQQAKEEEEVDIYGYCCVMRSNRVNMIQTLEQYIFVYDGLLEALMSGDTSIPCPELAQRYEEMKKVDPETNKSELQHQFDVLQVLKPAKREEKLTALEPQNKDKNRDLEVVPSNRFRPFLSIKVDGCTDYINAVYIDGYKVRLAYVLTQSPLSNTITDIWRLAYDHASRTIVMLNQLGDDDDDCPVYWPTDKDIPLVFGPLTVTLVDEKVDSVTPSITVRDFSIAHSNKPNNAVIVKQFHLTSWADGEMLPECSKDLLDVMDLVERWQQQSANGPVTIHCRNGSDKSGLYCAASYTVEKLKLDREVDVFHAVKHVRVCRPSAVPSMEQYMYLHELGLEYIEKFEIYANFK